MCTMREGGDESLVHLVLGQQTGGAHGLEQRLPQLRRRAALGGGGGGGGGCGECGIDGAEASVDRGGAARRRAHRHLRERLAGISGTALRHGLAQRDELVLLRRLDLHEVTATHVGCAAEAGQWRGREHKAVAARHLHAEVAPLLAQCRRTLQLGEAHAVAIAQPMRLLEHRAHDNAPLRVLGHRLQQRLSHRLAVRVGRGESLAQVGEEAAEDAATAAAHEAHARRARRLVERQLRLQRLVDRHHTRVAMRLEGRRVDGAFQAAHLDVRVERR